MLNCLGESSTVYGILSGLVFWVYVSWHIQCHISDPMYQLSSPSCYHGALSFGILLITIIVPGGDNGVRL